MLNKYYNAIRSKAHDLWDRIAGATVKIEDPAVANLYNNINLTLKEEAWQLQVYLEDHPVPARNSSEDPVDYANRTKFVVDWSNLVLDTLASLYVYQGGPSRRWGQDLLRGVFWGAYEKSNSLNLLLRSIERMMIFHGTVFVEHRFVAMDRPVKLIPYMPHTVDAVPSPEDPTVPEVVRVLVWRKTKAEDSFYYADDTLTVNTIPVGTNHRVSGMDEVYQIWTRDRVYLMDGYWKEIAPSVSHGYGAPPFTVFRNEVTWNQLYCKGIGKKLVSANSALDEQYSEIFDAGMNLFGQPVVKGRLIGPKVFSRWVPLEIDDPQGGFNREGPKTDINGHLAIIDRLLDDTAMSLNIPPGVFKAAIYAQRDRSSLAIQAVMAGPSNWRETRVQLMTSIEDELHARSARIYESHVTGARIAPDFSISFPDPQRVLSASDQREERRLILDNGLMPKWVILQEMRPWLSADEAKSLAGMAEGDNNGGARDPESE